MLKSSVASEPRYSLKSDNAGLIQTPLRISGVD